MRKAKDKGMGKLGKRIIAMVMPIIMVAIVSLCLCLPMANKDVGNNNVDYNSNNTPIYFASAEETGASTASSTYKGGAIYVGVNANYTMKGGTIEGKTNTYGGAVFISSGATFTMEGGTITGCQAKYGGAIYVASGGTCNIYGGSITGNKAEHAPAIYVEDGGTLNIQNDAVIENNEYAKYFPVSKGTVQVGGTYSGTASTLYLHYIEFGSYPQTYVGDSMNETLESWYNSSSPVNLKTYTTRENTRYNSGVYTSHMYTDGNIYARGYSYRANSYTYSTGESIPANGTVVWFKVEPIRWLVLNYDEYMAGTDAELELMSELVLTDYIYFNPSYNDGNSWETSYIREWMNGEFYNSAFAAEEQEMIATSTVLNNVTGNYSDGSGPTTYDKIYLRSYYEMSSGLFSTGTTNQDYARRQCSPTDFALSNYAGKYTSYSYRKETSYYWTRSAGSSASYARTVGSDGDLRNYDVDDRSLGVRPALKVTI